MRYRNAALCFLALLLAACKPTAPATDAAAPANAPDATAAAQAPATEPAAPPASAVDAAFAKDMPYADLRRRLLDAGWLPLRDPACRENVGGEARVCGELPEVESCSGDGHCVMHFANATEAQRMRVTAYGPYDRWNTPGEQAAFAVQSWERSPVTAAAAAPACPAQDFDAFLQRFAADEAIERAFTAPLVKVAELGGGEDGDDTVMVYVAGQQYTGFNVARGSDGYHFVDAEGARDAAPLPLQVSAAGENVRDVRYLYGMSEGNSYRFEARDGCWYLTQDPEPPSP
jgi:hypothetical protein